MAQSTPPKPTPKKGWRKTSELLPKNFLTVLARTENKQPLIAYYDKVTNAWYDADDILLNHKLNITEWQPIPK
ncbi:hypothetical protein ACFPK9_01065 [Rubritalea spongiae]|uniref:DUF551 domain-containing protein n=1 Tax=Rubritalea spongiae TaxID=430797 RepID=A0ABW5DYM5_9BACT